MYLIISVIIWGSNFVFGKILIDYFSPAMITMFRLLFIVLFLGSLSFFYWEKPKKLLKKDLFIIVLLGIFGVFINQWSFYVGLETADPTTAALILALTPILAGFLAVIFLKETVSIRMIFGSLIAIIGIFYVVTNGSFATVQIDKGLVWIIITMVTFAFMIIMTRVLTRRVDSFTITLYSNVIGFILSIPAAFTLDRPIVISTSLHPWLLLIGTAIVVHGIATLMWNTHIRYVDASKAAILSNLEPFIAMIVGLIILSKPITGLELLGALFIVSGVLLSTYEKKSRKFLQKNL